MQFRQFGFGLVALSVFLASSCREDPEILEPEPPVYGIVAQQPADWPAPFYNFEGNKPNDDVFRLGRKLFYEKALSRDNSTSCGSCHQQFSAFAHSEHNLSHGVDGLVGTRNTPGLFNLRWHPSFMWDGGVNHIEVQPAAPIVNPVEMDETLENVVTKISVIPEYRYLFKRAFGDEQVTTQRMFKSLALFMGMMDSWNSKYDRVKRSEAGVSFTTDEQAGYNLFKTNCATCHKEPLMSDFSYRSNGLSVDPVFKDSGRAHITSLASDRFKFKVPSLRNVELTSPYMHDGRFSSLYSCVDHYAKISGTPQGIDPVLIGGIALSENEKLQIIAFLKTLTDRSFTTDPRFADPFK